MIIHGDVWAKCTGDSHIMPLSCARQDCQGGYSGPPCRWPGDPAGTRQAVDLQRTAFDTRSITARLAAAQPRVTCLNYANIYLDFARRLITETRF